MDQRAFPVFGLMMYLRELSPEELWKFKELLPGEASKRQLKPIPWASIRIASSENLARLLYGHYSGSLAWDLCMNLLLQVSRTDLWEKMREDIEHRRNPYKKHMKEKFRFIWDRQICLPVPDSLYMKSCVHEYVGISKAYSIHAGPVTVALRGPEGSGKTILLVKAMLDWAENRLWQDRFSFVFFLNVYELNSNREMYLAEIVSRNWPATLESISAIFAEPERILFIMDGFEKLSLDLEPSGELCGDWRQRLRAQVILNSLLCKKMFPEASLLVALEHTGWQRVCNILHNPKDVYMGPLTEAIIESYISFFFSDEDKAQEALDFMLELTPLLLVCSSPLACWMVCSCIKWQQAVGMELQIISASNAGLYISFMVSAFRARNENWASREHRARLRHLCVLAAEGMWTQTFMFSQQDLERRGLSLSDVNMWQSMKILQKKEYYFIFHHMSMQAFCAALYYMLKQPKDGPSPDIGSIAQLITASVIHAHVFLSQVNLFLFGITNERSTNVLRAALGSLMSRQCKQDMGRCLQDLGQLEAQKKMVDFDQLFSALFEISDENFIRRVMYLFKEISLDIDDLDPLTIASFCLRYSQKLEKIRLRIHKMFSGDPSSIPSYHEIVHFWHQLCLMFVNSPKLRVLELDNCCFNETSVRILTTAVAQPACRLQTLLCNFTPSCGFNEYLFMAILHNAHLRCLNLYGTSLSIDAVRSLCEALRHPRSNIEMLILGKCNITEEACVQIAIVLSCSQRLRHLSLGENPVMDRGVALLSNALKHPKCVLQLLVLSYCCLSSISCNFLAEALLHNRSLRLLDLGYNLLLNKGVAALCEALRNRVCTLQELWLTSCYLTSECCTDIGSVLISSENLLKLSLGRNEIRDEGVKALCGALVHPNCRLQSLGLEACQLTSACFLDLASVLISCKKLWSLNVDGVSLDEEGLAPLRDALARHSCRLKLLGLDKEKLAVNLRSVLESLEAENPRLTISHHPWIEEEKRIKGIPQRGDP